MSRHQDGYIYRKGKTWRLRWREDVIENGQVVRKQRSEKIADYCDRYRSLKDVRPLVAERLKPLNENRLAPESSITLGQFVDGYWLKHIREQKRASTVQYCEGVWELRLKPRVADVRLRDFRTCDGERLLSDIARARQNLSRNSLKHIKSVLSGIFTYALRQGVLNGVPNPMQGTSVPQGRETEDTYAYQLPELQRMLHVLPEPARTVVMAAAYTGLRKGELRGMRWEDYRDGQVQVLQSIVNGQVEEPKTRKSKAPVPIIKPLADALKMHAAREGNPQSGPIFRAGNGQPLNLDNLARRVIMPALEVCEVCRTPKANHEPELKAKHAFKLDESLPRWHGWHAFRRGLATNLNELGVEDKTIQAILRHSDIATTMNIYVRSVSKSQVAAMQRLEDVLIREHSDNKNAENAVCAPFELNGSLLFVLTYRVRASYDFGAVAQLDRARVS